MNYLFKVTLVCFALICASGANCHQQSQQSHQQQKQPDIQSTNIPYYIQSPIAQRVAQPLAPIEQLSATEADQLVQRSLQPKIVQFRKGAQGARKLAPINSSTLQAGNNNLGSGSEQPVPVKGSSESSAEPVSCLYDKRYFAKLDECLARKPYPTVGLSAFKNEDMLIKRGISDKYGCVFILNNGLFKNYQISKFSIDSDSQCLDGSKVGLSMSFANVSLNYLWTLRCLNRADQLLDDATLNGQTIEEANTGSTKISSEENRSAGVCIGSSQNFGFASLQLTNIEAQVELATDIYKNWRLTNVTVAMISPSGTFSVANHNPPLTSAINGDHNNGANEQSEMLANLGTNIKEYVFESLDGDELNWRYLHLFQNWSRNRMHTNFLEQYRRFLWISLQHCLSENSESLPVNLFDVFTNQRYT